MTDVIVTMKIMPENLDVALEQLKEVAHEKISAVGKVTEVKEEAVAFGIKALIFTFYMDEEKGGTEELEKSLLALDDVSSADVLSATRALG